MVNINDQISSQHPNIELSVTHVSTSRSGLVFMRSHTWILKIKSDAASPGSQNSTRISYLVSRIPYPVSRIPYPAFGSTGRMGHRIATRSATSLRIVVLPTAFGRSRSANAKVSGDYDAKLMLGRCKMQTFESCATKWGGSSCTPPSTSFSVRASSFERLAGR